MTGTSGLSLIWAYTSPGPSEQLDHGQHFIWGNSWDTAGSVVLSLQTAMVHLLLLVRLPVEPSSIGGPWARQARQNLTLPELPYFLSKRLAKGYNEAYTHK